MRYCRSHSVLWHGRPTATRSALVANRRRTGVLNAEQALQLRGRILQRQECDARSGGRRGACTTPRFVQLPLGVGYANRDGTLIWCNDAFDRMLGLAPGEHLQKTIRDLTNAVDMPSNDQLLTDLWEGRRNSYSLEKRYVRRDGTELWVHVTAAMIRTRDGEPVCTVGFLEDITARKNMEGEVERVQKALMDASRQAGMAEVATNVLHNVGNVLNSVNVSASLVADRIKASKGARLGGSGGADRTEPGRPAAVLRRG